MVSFLLIRSSSCVGSSIRWWFHLQVWGKVSATKKKKCIDDVFFNISSYNRNTSGFLTTSMLILPFIRQVIKQTLLLSLVQICTYLFTFYHVTQECWHVPAQISSCFFQILFYFPLDLSLFFFVLYGGSTCTVLQYYEKTWVTCSYFNSLKLYNQAIVDPKVY